MPQKILPCCFFPTEVLLVDDDQTFLDTLAYTLESKGIKTSTFINPNDALQAVKQQDTLDLTKLYSTSVDVADNSSVYETKTDLSGIAKYAFNKNGTRPVSVIVSDYHMLPINGLTFLSQVHSPDIKKILLTAVASDDTAVRAFNDGTIDTFISKSEQHLADKIFAAIQNLQFTLFAEQSLAVYRLYDNVANSKPFLQNKAFLSWFKSFITDHNINAFYLVTEFGMLDFILLKNDDNEHQVSWLSLRDDSDMFALLDLARSHGSTISILARLENCSAIPMVTNKEDAECPPDQWHTIMRPTHGIPIEDMKVFYSYVENVDWRCLAR